MNIQSVLALLISILFLLLSVWNLNTFNKLKSNENDKMTKNYVKTGYMLSIICSVFAVIVMIILSINVYMTV
jgi:uncharacterized membrane protein YidH (DUF202 family)